MTPRARVALLSLHLLVSVGWIGGVLCYLALGVVAVVTSEPATVLAMWVGMEVLGWWVLVPQAVLALATGVLLSLLTRWGLLQHYWVVVALVLTTLCAVVLVVHMVSVSATVEVARTAGAAHLMRLGGDLAHPAVGLVLLVLVLVLNVSKPRGLTRRGWRARARADRG